MGKDTIGQGLLSIANEHSVCETKTMMVKRKATTTQIMWTEVMEDILVDPSEQNIDGAI